MTTGPEATAPSGAPRALWPDWHAVAEVRPDGPNVTVLHQTSELKVVLVALPAGAALPEHVGPAACFHFLDGQGLVLLDGQQLEVAAGATAVVPTGARRGVRATSDLVFLGNLGNPESERGPF